MTDEYTAIRLRTHKELALEHAYGGDYRMSREHMKCASGLRQK